MTENNYCENDETKFNRTCEMLLFAAAVGMALTHMLYTRIAYIDSIRFLNMHLGFALFIVFIGAAQKSRSKAKTVANICLLVFSIVCIVYVHLLADILSVRVWANTTLDLVIGALLMIVVLYASVIAYGWLIPGIIIAVALYPIVGQMLPEPFTTISYTLKQAIANLSIGTIGGIYGVSLSSSANFIFMFMIFGGLLGATGVQHFFWELGKLIFRNLKSGPGLLAVWNSMLVGSITGSAVANVTITGPYTIPLMKKSGYRPESAAALEASASNGGQILPPVMGIVAFVMASYSGIPYIRICIMAAIPALLLYLCVALYAHLSISKDDLKYADVLSHEPVDKKLMLANMPSFIVPIALIVFLLAKGVGIMSTAFYAIIALTLITLLTPRQYRTSFRKFIEGMVSGVTQGAKLGVLLGAIGIMLTTLTGTGIAVKLSAGMAEWSGGNLLVALIMLWFVCMVLGMIGVSTVAYLTSAAFAVPVLVACGVPFDTAHFFLTFPTVFALITPPIALAVIVAAEIAEAKYLKAAVETVKASFLAFLLPFFVVYAPSLLFKNGINEAIFWIEIGLTLLIILSGQIAFCGYFLSELKIYERVAEGLCFSLLTIYIINRLPVFLVVGLFCGILGLLSHLVGYIRGKYTGEHNNKGVGYMV